MRIRNTIKNPVAAANRRRVASVVPAHKGRGTNNKRKEDKRDAYKYQENADKEGQ